MILHIFVLLVFIKHVLKLSKDSIHHPVLILIDVSFVCIIILALTHETEENE